MLLAWRLTLAHHLDWWEQRLRRIGEKLGWPQAWLHEFIAYRGDPRMTIEEFWVRFTLLRMDAEKILKPKMSVYEARRFYQEHEYMLWRNLVHRRHSAWRRVLVTMRGNSGSIWEYGCGIAPVTAYIKRRRPQWYRCATDLESPHWNYAMWRVKSSAFRMCDIPWEVITALDVFEHLTNPMKIAASLVANLKPGGYLHYNIHRNPSANDLDLATAEQLDATERYLESALDIVWRKNEYRVGRKR